MIWAMDDQSEGHCLESAARSSSIDGTLLVGSHSVVRVDDVQVNFLSIFVNSFNSQDLAEHISFRGNVGDSFNCHLAAHMHVGAGDRRDSFC